MTKMELTRLSWMDEEEFDDLNNASEKFETFCNEYKGHKNMERFSRDKAISMVFSDKKLEYKLPDDVKDSKEYKYLETISVDTKYEIKVWKADGNDDHSESQLVQHLKAYYYLMSQRPLTFDAILEAHRILMLGAISDNEHNVQNGKIRTINVNNGAGHDYQPHNQVEENLRRLLNDIETSNPVKTAYKLFWNFLDIHPFEDGNGRIARLLFAYHLCHSGTPFPVAITSGSHRQPRSNRKHYNNAIVRNHQSNRKDLYTLLSYSVHLGWKDFLESKDVIKRSWIERLGFSYSSMFVALAIVFVITALYF